MKEERLHRWSKSVDGDQLGRWETELTAAGVDYVAEKAAGRKRWKLSTYEPDRSAAEALKSRFGGGVSALRPEDWQPREADESRVVKIRDRFVITQQSGDGAIAKLAAEFPGREILSFPPRMAFGTGDHPTTAGCLRLLVDESRRPEKSAPWPMLDLGCGSGILSIAAARLGADPVVAVEFDGAAIAIARDNAGRNGIGDRIQFVEADAAGWTASQSRSETGGGFRVIAANLFSELLIAILPHLPKHLAPGGVVILSGFLTSQAKDIHAAAAKAGVRLGRFIRRGRWVAAAGRLA